MEPDLVKRMNDEFTKAVREVFSVQFSMDVAVQAEPAANSAVSPNSCVVAVISLSETKMSGALVLRMPNTSFCAMVNQIFSENHTEVNSGNADAVAEFLNMIYGVARPRLNAGGMTLQPAIPSVMWGADVNVSLAGYESATSLRCKYLNHSFDLLLGCKSTGK